MAFLPQDRAKLDLIIRLLSTLLREGDYEMATLEDIRAEVARNTDVDASAVQLLKALTDKIQQLIDQGADPAALQGLVDELKSNNDKLAAAVAANTPGANPDSAHAAGM